MLDPGACVSESINTFLRSVVTYALNPMLALLGDTLLATPTPTDLPRLAQLWAGSWRILLACYGLLVLAAGIVVMGYETVQARHALREIAPRVVIGFLAGAVSLSLASTAIEAANALSTAMLAAGVEETGAATALRELIESALTSDSGASFLLIMGAAVVVALLALLLTYVVRVALTIVLVAGAPIALMFHALPHTEGIARWWWRSFGACLAIQVVQSLTLVVALNVLLTPGGGFGFAGADAGDGFVTLLVVLALLYVLFKIPFWLLSASRVGNGRSLLGSLVRGFIAYKTFGLLSGRGRGGGGGGGRPGRRPGGGPRGGPGRGGPRGGPGGGPGGGSPRGGASGGAAGGGPGGAGSRPGGDPGGGPRGGPTNGGGGCSRPAPGPTDPYAHTQATRDGQLLLPLGDLTRRRRRPSPPPTEPAARPPRTGRQLPLPLADGDWPEHRPVLGRDGQYRLPIAATRARPTAPPPAPPPRSRTAGRAGRQLPLPFDPHQPNHPRPGRYPVPPEGAARRPTRAGATTPTPTARASGPPTPRGKRPAQPGAGAPVPPATPRPATPAPRRRPPSPPGDPS